MQANYSIIFNAFTDWPIIVHLIKYVTHECDYKMYTPLPLLITVCSMLNAKGYRNFCFTSSNVAS